MTGSLSNRENNLLERIHRIKCKCELWNCKCCDFFLECTHFKDDLTEYKCLCRRKNYQYKFHEKFKGRFFGTYKFSNHDNNKFILLLRKDIHPHE